MVVRLVPSLNSHLSGVCDWQSIAVGSHSADGRDQPLKLDQLPTIFTSDAAIMGPRKDFSRPHPPQYLHWIFLQVRGHSLTMNMAPFVQPHRSSAVGYSTMFNHRSGSNRCCLLACAAHLVPEIAALLEMKTGAD
jgi:hypothetical protein